MSQPFNAIEVGKNVYWVGAIDWHLRDFHGYATERGTTYNAFLILDEKVTLIDTVKRPFKDEMMSRIASIISPDKIDYVISNHAEMDHSGALPAVIREVNPEKVFASAKGVEALEAHFHELSNLITVKDAETLSLGEGNITFYETRMLHWPDSMFTFFDTAGILFTQDAFGMHLASSERFADELDSSVLEFEAAKYFANILTPYATLVGKQLAKTKALNLPIEMIAPDHGPIYRKDLNWILDLYSKFSAQEPTNKAMIVYDTMWGSTDMMARAIADGIVDAGGEVSMFEMSDAHRSNVATALLDAGALVVGSPTINNMIFPTVADVLSYIKGLRPRNLVGAAFGSYGWGGEAVKQITETLEFMKIDLVSEGIRIKYVPTHEDLGKCHELGGSIGKIIAENRNCN